MRKNTSEEVRFSHKISQKKPYFQAEQRDKNRHSSSLSQSPESSNRRNTYEKNKHSKLRRSHSRSRSRDRPKLVKNINKAPSQRQNYGSTDYFRSQAFRPQSKGFQEKHRNEGSSKNLLRNYQAEKYRPNEDYRRAKKKHRESSSSSRSASSVSSSASDARKYSKRKEGEGKGSKNNKYDNRQTNKSKGKSSRSSSKSKVSEKRNFQNKPKDREYQSALPRNKIVPDYYSGPKKSDDKYSSHSWRQEQDGSNKRNAIRFPPPPLQKLISYSNNDLKPIQATFSERVVPQSIKRAESQQEFSSSSVIPQAKSKKEELAAVNNVDSVLFQKRSSEQDLRVLPVLSSAKSLNSGNIATVEMGIAALPSKERLSAFTLSMEAAKDNLNVGLPQTTFLLADAFRSMPKIKAEMLDAKWLSFLKEDNINFEGLKEGVFGQVGERVEQARAECWMWVNEPPTEEQLDLKLHLEESRKLSSGLSDLMRKLKMSG